LARLSKNGQNFQTGFERRDGGSMANSIELKFKKIQKEFLEFLKYTKGHDDSTDAKGNFEFKRAIKYR